MQYALLIYMDEQADRNETARAAMHEHFDAFTGLLVEREAMRGGAELATAATATTIQKQQATATDGVVTDGPYAELAEQLAGFYLIEAPDLDAALDLARRLPAKTVEVRPIIPQMEAGA
ncbi:MAG TPA: YciI family protein [Conexibacter sp.]